MRWHRATNISSTQNVKLSNRLKYSNFKNQGHIWCQSDCLLPNLVLSLGNKIGHDSIVRKVKLLSQLFCHNWSLDIIKRHFKPVVYYLPQGLFAAEPQWERVSDTNYPTLKFLILHQPWTPLLEWMWNWKYWGNYGHCFALISSWYHHFGNNYFSKFPP